MIKFVKFAVVLASIAICLVALAYLGDCTTTGSMYCGTQSPFPIERGLAYIAISIFGLGTAIIIK